MQGLTHWPFELKEDAEMVARYLMDEEEAQEVDYDKSGNICRIRSIVRNWLNQYDLFPDQVQLEG